jgi:D-alanyl-D-alanine carboxypeptidase/D-alanyl-D-alanine-endopeptidase (penicillin-binding protein 4)
MRHALSIAILMVLHVVTPAIAADAVPASLASMLEPVLKERAFRSFRSSMHIVRVQDGEVVFSEHADRALVPASTMKTVTAAAALRYLGPSYRFETSVLHTGEVDPEGVLHGDLVIRGSGDPSLVVERLWKLVDDLAFEGVTRIDGDVLYDDSAHTDEAMLPGWGKPEDIKRGPAYFATLGGLSVNHNAVRLSIGPGREVGTPGRVRLGTPAPGYVAIDASELVTSASRTRYGIERVLEEDGTMTFKVSGQVGVGRSERRLYRTVHDPTRHFMSMFADLLQRAGIEVTGTHKQTVTPGDAKELLSHRSPPLTVILMDMNKFSNNFIAEQVLRAIGREVEGEGSTEAGLTVVRRYLTSLGIPTSEFEVANGSGLSRQTSLRATHLTAVLMDMVKDPRVGAEFRSSLAIAGLDGTLWRRLPDEAGRLRGKTGTVDGVHCLVGYVEGSDRQLYAFAFLANDIRSGTSTVKGIHDRLARKILDAPDTPAAP